MRAFDKSLTEVAAVVALLMGGAVLSAMMAGGLIVDRLAKRDLRWHLWLPCLATAASLPFYTLYFLVPDFGFAIASGAVAMFLLGLYSAPLEAAVIGSAHPRARAISLAVMGLAGGTTGGILGPVTVGVVSDWLEPAYGALSLRWRSSPSSRSMPVGRSPLDGLPALPRRGGHACRRWPSLTEGTGGDIGTPGLEAPRSTSHLPADHQADETRVRQTATHVVALFPVVGFYLLHHDLVERVLDVDGDGELPEAGA